MPVVFFSPLLRDMRQHTSYLHVNAELVVPTWHGGLIGVSFQKSTDLLAS